MKSIISAFMTICFLLFSYQANALIAVPDFNRPIVDTTGTLTSLQMNTLENKLLNYQSSNRNSSQIAVLVVPTLDGESIEQYATRVFEQWKVGKKELDNGVLLVIAKDDRTIRIEVGYGVEGDLPDLSAKRIIDQSIIPAFRQNDYYKGIDDGVNAIINRLNKQSENDEDGSPQQIASVQDVFDSDFGGVLLNYAGISFIICFFAGRILSFSWLKKSLGRQSLAIGGLNSLSTGGFSLFNGLPFSVIIPILFLTFVASTILCGFLSINRSSGGGSFRGPRNGGGFGGSRGGFGGGGGGRSGGGGASGCW